MITPKEIENRKYDGKKLIAFEYTIKGLEDKHGQEKELRVWFESVNPLEYRLLQGRPTYKVFTIINGVVYEQVFQMPKSNMNLELVVARGLNFIHFVLQDELAFKEMVSYTIADITRDM